MTTFTIYGEYDTPNVKALHNEKDGFLVHGFVEDGYEVMNSAKVLLAPLRFGAGLKGKLIQAMQTGTPCAMSSIAACLIPIHYCACNYLSCQGIQIFIALQLVAEFLVGLFLCV